MKVLYAIQATGNGHLSRAEQLVPCLRKRMETDVLVSGVQGELNLPFEVKFQCKGYGFIFGKNGGIDWMQTFKKNSIGRFMREVSRVPVKNYDLVITDFEPVSAWASFIKGVHCIGIGNQYALNLPEFQQPSGKFPVSKFVIRNYTPTFRNYPIFYKELNSKTSLPIIRNQIRELEPRKTGYYLVYLSAYHPDQINTSLNEFPEFRFKVFTRYINEAKSTDHIKYYPLGNQSFVNALSYCSGVITHSGFGLTSECLYLGKKMFVIPMKGQYEQICNAAFLHKEYGIHTANNLKEALNEMGQWLVHGKAKEVYYPDKSQKWIDNLLSDFLLYKTMFLSQPREEMQTTFG